jgi:translocation and assembly module TamB
MIRRYLNLLLLAVTLTLLPVAHSEMPISINSSLNSFEHDLENIHLKLERLSAHWELSPADGTLQVHVLKAERLIIQLKDSAAPSEPGKLPEKISLPLPISIKQAEIKQVVIISSDGKQLLQQVRFNLNANAKTITLNLQEANTPWGNIVANVDMATAKPFALQGAIQVKQLVSTDSAYGYDIKTTLSGNLEQLQFSSDNILTQQAGKFYLQSSTDASNNAENIAGRIAINGHIGLAQDKALQLNLHIADLRAERLGSYPQAQFNIEASVNGKLNPQPDLTLQIRTPNSHWQNQPLNVEANLQWINSQIKALQMQASLGSNQLVASGDLGAAGSTVNWNAKLPELKAFSEHLTGDIAASGDLRGSFEKLMATFNLSGKNIAHGTQFKLASLSANATLGNAEADKISAIIKADTLEIGERPALNVLAELSGTLAQHQLQITAKNTQQQWLAALNGGIKSNDVNQEKFWQGWLQQLSYDGETTIKLKAPAPLKVSAHHKRLEQVALQFASGELNIAFADLSDSAFSSQGSLKQMRVSDLPEDIFIMPASLQGSPVFSGNWNITAKDQINGSLTLQRDSGDFMLNKLNTEPTALGLSNANLLLEIINNKVSVMLDVSGQQLGNLHAQLTTEFNKTEAGFALLASAPFKLNASAQLTTLAWVPFPNTLADAELDGKVSLSVSADGTLAAPDLRGTFNGKDLVFNLASQGVALNQGSFDATFAQNKLLINHFVWHGGAGTISTSGYALLAQQKPKLALDWKAEQFTALSRTDRLLILSGSGKTQLQDDILSVSGDFLVNKGLIEIVGENAPSLSDDVIVIGRSQVIQQAPLQVLLNSLNINLGQDFILRGHGLDALLFGELSLTGLTQYQPHTEGSIQVKRGTFMAYGQLLNIERGILNFNGPTENPGLNIRAMRNTKPVSAGVEITGTAFAPITKLVSTPNVSETEKLSWLVLGHGLDKAGKNQYAMLSLAAGVLFSNNQSVPLQTKIARAAGLDELSFAGSDAESAAVNFGKRLGSDLYLNYEKSVSGLLDVARLTYFITPVWSVRGASGAESAVDVLYTFSFK